MALCRQCVVYFGRNRPRILSAMADTVRRQYHTSSVTRSTANGTQTRSSVFRSFAFPVISVNFISDIPIATFHTGQLKLAGHNKWSKVRHIKGPKDLARSKEFGKLIQRVKFAVQNDGPDPTKNSALANLIQMAKSIGMPKSTMEGVLSKASTGAKGDATTSIIFEARGPGGSCLLLDILTDSTRRSRQELRKLLHKLGCSLGEPGTAMYAFAHKGIIRVLGVREDESVIPLDEALEIAIVVGAEDVIETESQSGEQMLMFVCNPKEIRKVRDNLEAEGWEPSSVSLEYLPQTTVTLKDSELDNAAEIIDQVSDHVDVVKVYDNITSES